MKPPQHDETEKKARKRVSLVHELDKQVAALRTDVQSDRLSMSIGELEGLYERQEIDIHPKFQRVLRWSNEQKTRLIESILLRIPVPALFVAQAEDSTWDVVDGVQRIGTIFEFLGILRGLDDKTVRPPLKLSGTVLLPDLEDTLFETANANEKSFSPALRLDFRRSRLDLHIILKESTPSSKYELFERLNTGGSIASPQEVRNCVLVWMNETLFDWMLELSKNEHFRHSIPLSDRLEEQQFRMELLLRFFVFYRIKVNELRGIKDLSDLLNDKNRQMAADDSFDGVKLKRTFEATFRFIDEALGDDAFRKYSVDSSRFMGAFLISAFEAIAMGVAFNIERWEAESARSEKLLRKVKRLWSLNDFNDNIGIGVSSSARMLHTIPLGRTHFVP